MIIISERKKIEKIKKGIYQYNMPEAAKLLRLSHHLIHALIEVCKHTTAPILNGHEIQVSQQHQED